MVKIGYIIMLDKIIRLIDMEEQTIKFTIHKCDLSSYLFSLCECFGRYHSVYFPIYIIWDNPHELLIHGDEGKDIINFSIVEAYDDLDKGFEKIAKMKMVVNRDCIFVVIEGDQSSRKRWYEVEKLAHALLDFFWDSSYQISTVSPSGFMKFHKLLMTKDSAMGTDRDTLAMVAAMEKEEARDQNSSKTDISIPDNVELEGKKRSPGGKNGEKPSAWVIRRKSLWRLIRGWYQDGMTISEISRLLKTDPRYKRYLRDRSTIKKTIEEGLAGKLDN